MRLVARELDPVVATNPGGVRPIRLRLGGLTYALDPDEAVELATALVAAIDELKAP